jgi:hypothetical protein
VDIVKPVVVIPEVGLITVPLDCVDDDTTNAAPDGVATTFS